MLMCNSRESVVYAFVFIEHTYIKLFLFFLIKNTNTALFYAPGFDLVVW